VVPYRLHGTSAVNLTVTGDSERVVLLQRLLQQVSLHERHEVIRLRRMPVARLRLHHQPAPGPVAVSGIWAG
jgi:hypothetical protein